MPSITSLSANKILDSRGDETIEVSVELDNGTGAQASVPQGKSKGSSEAFCISPNEAILKIESVIEPALHGLDPQNQREIDKALIELDATKNKESLGANTMLATSIACARVSAFSENIPLWQHLRKLFGESGTPEKRPRLFMNFINGGLHGENNLDFQEYLIIPKTNSFREASLVSEQIYKKLNTLLKEFSKSEDIEVGEEGGFSLNFKDNFEPFEILSDAIKLLDLRNEIDFGLDAAANSIKKKANELFLDYALLKKTYNLIYIEDPFVEGDYKCFSELLKDIGKNTVIAGDDLTVTNLKMMKKAHTENAVNGVIIKPNQIGTLSETLDAIEQAKKWGWQVIVSHRSGETKDDFISDLAFATETDGIKLGVPIQKERITKHKRLIEIEESI